MLRFKDIFPLGIEYRPGEDALTNYIALRRHRGNYSTGEGGPISESISEDDDVEEALSLQTRLQKGRDVRRNKAKIKLGRSRAERRFASGEVLKKRARRAAYKAAYKKISKGVPSDELPPARKSEIEKRLAKPAFQNRISRMALKLIKDVRKKEMDRKRG